MTQELFNPFTPEFLRDPYTLYRRYLSNGRVHRGLSPNPKLEGAWYVLGHAELMQALHDERLGREARKILKPEDFPVLPSGYRPFASMFRKWLVFLDPPDHTRLRRLVQRSFTPDVVARLRPRVHALAHELIDQFIDHGQVELVSEFALPLPLIVIAELLGVESKDRKQFAEWSHAMSQPRSPVLREKWRLKRFLSDCRI